MPMPRRPKYAAFWQDMERSLGIQTKQRFNDYRLEQLTLLDAAVKYVESLDCLLRDTEHATLASETRKRVRHARNQFHLRTPQLHSPEPNWNRIG